MQKIILIIRDNFLPSPNYLFSMPNWKKGKLVTLNAIDIIVESLILLEKPTDSSSL